MSRKIIAYQGEPGANSHMACMDVYPDWEPLPCETFEDALGAIQDGTAQLGMIPIENSLAGRVADIHHLLPASGLHIVGEYFLPIHFQLMAIKGATLEGIKEVYSHIHGLGQCRKIIKKLGLKAHNGGDTAGSARQVAEWKDATRAALAPAMAADIYGLDILARDGLITREGAKITLTPAGEGLARIVASTFDSYFRHDRARHSVAV